MAFGKYRPKRLKIVNFGPNLTILGHFRGQKFFSTKKFFRRFLSHMESQLHAKNQKKIMNGQGCRTGTDVRTDVRTDARTHESEFIGSFRSLKTSGEPKNRF